MTKAAGETPCAEKVPGVSDTEILLGAHLPLSGYAATWGVGLKAGMEATESLCGCMPSAFLVPGEHEFHRPPCLPGGGVRAGHGGPLHRPADFQVADVRRALRLREHAGVPQEAVADSTRRRIVQHPGGTGRIRSVRVSTVR